MLTVKILQIPALRSFVSCEYHATELSQFASACLGSSLYSLGADPTENAAFNHFYIVVTGDYLALPRILLMCLPAVTKQSMFLLSIIA
jgi:hypothetical protein